MSQIISLLVGDRACELGVAQQYFEVRSYLIKMANWFDEEDPVDHSISWNKYPRTIYVGNNVSKAYYNTKLEDSQQTIITEYIKGMDLSPKNFYHYNRNFYHDEDIFTHQVSEQSIEEFSDCLSTQLELLNRCDGFEMIVDCESLNGALSVRMLELIMDYQGNKCPKLVFSLHDRPDYKQSDRRLINKALTFTALQSKADILIPLTIQPDDPMYHKLAMTVYNITQTYKLKHEHETLETICSRLLPQHNNNIFNTCHQIPSLEDSKEKSILNYKSRIQECPLQEQILPDSIAESESFGESYVLRGMSPIPDQRNIRSYGLDIKIMDDIYLIPAIFQQTIKSETLAYHTCIFSNESYKFTLQKYLDEFKKLKVSAFLPYEKQGLDDKSQIVQHLNELVENYGGIEVDEDNCD